MSDGIGDEEPLISAIGPSVLRRRGDGVLDLLMLPTEEPFTSTRRPGAKGRGGEGSAASFSSSVGKRESGSLGSSDFSSSCGTSRY